MCDQQLSDSSELLFFECFNSALFFEIFPFILFQFGMSNSIPTHYSLCLAVNSAVDGMQTHICFYQLTLC